MKTNTNSPENRHKPVAFGGRQDGRKKTHPVEKGLEKSGCF